MADILSELKMARGALRLQQELDERDFILVTQAQEHRAKVLFQLECVLDDLIATAERGGEGE